MFAYFWWPVNIDLCKLISTNDSLEQQKIYADFIEEEIKRRIENVSNSK